METSGIEVFMKKILTENYFEVDQWQFGKYVRVLRKSDVHLYSFGIVDMDRQKLFVKNVASIEPGIDLALKKHRAHAKIAVIPGGPYILADLD